MYIFPVFLNISCPLLTPEEMKKDDVVENSIITDIVPTVSFTVKVFFLTITINT
jgi:hypothetical protein